MKYFGECQDAGDIEYVFGLYAADEPPTDNEVVFACIENRYYEGYAFVVYRRGGKLYEVNSSHCSCNGFTWEPEETTEAALAIRKFSFLSAAARAALRTLYPPRVAIAAVPDGGSRNRRLRRRIDGAAAKRRQS